MPKTTSGFASKPLIGEKHPRWKGGKTIRMGYLVIRMPHHPNAHNGYVFAHRFMIEQRIGRYLRPGETVHHINGDRLDNRPENLKIVTHTEHGITHGMIRFPQLRDKTWLEEKTKTMGSRAIAKLIGCNPRSVYDFQKFHGITSSLKGGRPKKS